MDAIKPDIYIIAVSGGVDSVVLLDKIMKRYARKPGYTFMVAHFDHGMRADSAVDCQFVETLAGSYGLPFVSAAGQLGAGASEATARQARYEFLQAAQTEAGAGSIVTAHHQDDLLETAIINLRRGTGRRGLTSMLSNHLVTRPLLASSKASLLAYARRHRLQWREDSTNADDRYRRNYVRHQLLSRFTAADRQALLDIIYALHGLNTEIDNQLTRSLKGQLTPDGLDRAWFRGTSHAEAKEYMATWLRSAGLRSYDTKTLERAVIDGKVGRSGTRIPLKKNYEIKVGHKTLALQVVER